MNFLLVDYCEYWSFLVRFLMFTLYALRSQTLSKQILALCLQAEFQMIELLSYARKNSEIFFE